MAGGEHGFIHREPDLPPNIAIGRSNGGLECAFARRHVMKAVVLAVAICAALTGCENKRDLTTDPIAAPAPTYVLFGTVRDSAGAPVANATAVVTTGKYLGRFALSNESGYFKFFGLLGPLTLRVTKEDYEMADKPLDVRG